MVLQYVYTVDILLVEMHTCEESFTCAGHSLVAEEREGGEASGHITGVSVQALLNLRETYDKFILESFAGDLQFRNTVDLVSDIYSSIH